MHDRPDQNCQHQNEKRGETEKKRLFGMLLRGVHDVGAGLIAKTMTVRHGEFP